MCKSRSTTAETHEHVCIASRTCSGFTCPAICAQRPVLLWILYKGVLAGSPSSRPSFVDMVFSESAFAHITIGTYTVAATHLRNTHTIEKAWGLVKLKLRDAEELVDS